MACLNWEAAAASATCFPSPSRAPQPELHARRRRPERRRRAGAITAGTGSLASGGSQSCTVSATSTTLGVTTISFTGSDPNSSNLSQTATASLTVLDHAAAAFTNSGTVLTLNFGTLQLGSGTRDLQYQIENLPAAYRAGLALESVMALSDPVTSSARMRRLSQTCLPARRAG